MIVLIKISNLKWNLVFRYSVFRKVHTCISPTLEPEVKNMSILIKTEDCWVISHEQFYKLSISRSTITSTIDESIDLQSHSSAEDIRELSLNHEIFNMNHPYHENFTRKGKLQKDHQDQDEEIKERVNLIQKLFHDQIQCLDDFKILFKSDKVNGNGDDERNLIARGTEKDLYNHFQTQNWPEFYGQNDHQNSVLSKVNGLGDLKFIFPPKTIFYCKDIMKIGQELEGKKYRILCIDPPWQNKFIKRRKKSQIEAGYKLLDSEDISQIPIDEISDSKAIVAVWITNRKKHQDELISKIFKKWKFSYLATWYWLKVTRSGEPICSFKTNLQKQPYETIILGVKSLEYFEPKDNFRKTRIIISTPSSIHSHKPPIIKIIRDFIPKEILPEDLPSSQIEIFARYLTSGITSYGNEVLKLNHESLFI